MEHLRSPAVHHMLGLNNENDWSNLLASLIETDQETARSLLGLAQEGSFKVRREVTSGPNRPDIVATDATGATLAVVEVKVLSGLGSQQLARYAEAIEPAARDSASLLVVYPERLPIYLPAASPWRALTWEAALGGFAVSAHPWVAQTAAAALAHMQGKMPDVGPGTCWCDLADGEDFVIALRARQAWVYGAVADPPRGAKVLHPSSAGVSWVTTVRIPTARDGYSIILETEETLPVRNWPKCASQDHRMPRGPSVRLFLLQEGVSTSADFDWDWLLHLWLDYMAPSGKPWVTNPANTKALHDRQGRDRIRAKGAPKHLGIGYGHGQVMQTKECMFGARYFLGNATLREVADDMNQTTALALSMASCRHWQPGPPTQEASWR